MNNWRDTLLSDQASVLDAIRTIDATQYRIALIHDDQDRLVGTVTDGDVRRGLLRKVALDGPVGQVMNRSPRIALPNEPVEHVRSRMQTELLRQMPVVDADDRVIGLEYLVDQDHFRPNWVVLMAGGLGTRLHPLTENTPKPLLKVGDKPILETILETLLAQNFRNFYISVNYKAEMVTEYFGDGRKWNANIRYLHEYQRLGTAGALSLIEEQPEHPVLVMNGDLLTKLNFGSLLEYHLAHGAQATACVREYDVQVPFGVVKLDNHRIVRIDEKPVHRFFVNAGIYVLDPSLIASVPRDTMLDMPQLLENALIQGDTIAAFPIREYWMDVGRPDDFRLANGDFARVFGPKA